MQITQKIEYHVADNCNLSCEFCSHYSNIKRPSRLVSPDEARAEWEFWSDHVAPQRFSLIGGEPTLNPDLTELAQLACETWVGAEIWLYTNGTYLHRHPDLHNYVDRVVISMHYDDMSSIAREAERFRKVEMRKTHKWIHCYKVVDGKRVPFRDKKPRKSWEVCAAKRCFVLRDNALWKCPQIAFHADANIDWPEFVNYRPLRDPANLEAWLLKKAEKCCGCCPAKLVHHDKPLVQLNPTK